MRRRPIGRQRGVAVVLALLLTMLAVTVVTGLFWQQQVQVRSMENQRLRLQTKWILLSALDWARQVLRSDNSNVTTLDGEWARPLAETGLDQYVGYGRGEGENANATLSRRIIDAQSRYNLTNLTSGKKINEGQVTAFGRLLSNLQLDPGLAQVAAQALAGIHLARDRRHAAPVMPDNAAPAARSGAEPMRLVRLDDLLSLPGFTPKEVERLREFATVLPEPSKVNVNTAPPEVLAAVIDFSVPEAGALVASRKQAYFKDVTGDLQTRLIGKQPIVNVELDVKSHCFLVSSRILLDRAALDAQALICRDVDDNRVKTMWIRED